MTHGARATLPPEALEIAACARRWKPMKIPLIIAAVSAAFAMCAPAIAQVPDPKFVEPPAKRPMKLHVRGGKLVRETNKLTQNNAFAYETEPFTLRAVSVPETVWGEHVYEETLDAARRNMPAMNAIRFDIDEGLWLGLQPRMDGLPDKDAYRARIKALVAYCSGHGLYSILALKWTSSSSALIRLGENAGRLKYDGPRPMPGVRSVDFWKSVAEEFRHDDTVIFSLYNEPHSVSWPVWRDGGRVSAKDPQLDNELVAYDTPGMQTLLDTVRAQYSRALVIADGVSWGGGGLSGVVGKYALKGEDVMYGIHAYQGSDDWLAQLAGTEGKVAVMFSGIGPSWSPTPETVAALPGWTSRLFRYLDSHGLSACGAGWSTTTPAILNKDLRTPHFGDENKPVFTDWGKLFVEWMRRKPVPAK